MSIEERYEGVYTRNHLTSLKVLHISGSSQYVTPSIHEVDEHTKAKVLQSSSRAFDERRRMLKRFSEYSHPNPFDSKETASRNFKLRVCCNNNGPPPDDSNAGHFVALSYASHSEEWKPHDACFASAAAVASQCACPLTPGLWAAFMRVTGHSPFWVDQLCIDQDNETEKELAIGAMDFVYRAAIKVVVALEDIALDNDEAGALSDYAKHNIPLSKRPKTQLALVAGAFGKVLQSRWLQRAWCVHEFNVGRKPVFLIPVVTDRQRDDFNTTVLQVDYSFLSTISHVYVTEDIQNHRAGRFSLIQNSRITEDQISNTRRFINRLKALNMAEIFGTETVTTDGSYISMFTEIFSLGSKYVSDKLAILLNVMESGVYYRGTKAIDKEECYLLVSLLALAAGDATSLCASGRRLKHGHFGWFRMPSGTDHAVPPGLMNTPKIEDAHFEITKQGLHLDVSSICTYASLRHAPENLLRLSRLLIDHRAMVRTPSDRPLLRLDFEQDDSRYNELRLYYIQSLACALECGEEWMVEYGSRSGINLPGISLGWDEKLRSDFAVAVQFAHDVELEDDIGSDMEEAWLEEQGANGGEGTGRGVGQEEEGGLERQLDSLDDQHNYLYWLLLQFTDELITYGLAIPYEDERPPFPQPYAIHILLSHRSDDTPSSLVFLPILDEDECRDVELCLPSFLTDARYRWLARGWLLRKRNTVQVESGADDTSNPTTQLLVKTRIAGLDDFQGYAGVKKRVVVT